MTMKKSEENIEKLPKWVQFKIQQLERDLADVLQREKELLGSVEDSNVIICGYSFKDDNPLPRDSHIEFRTTDKKYPNFIVSIRDGGLYIQGSTAVTIEPSASNCCLIKTRN